LTGGAGRDCDANGIPDSRDIVSIPVWRVDRLRVYFLIGAAMRLSSIASLAVPVDQEKPLLGRLSGEYPDTAVHFFALNASYRW
jgi:hypothetical protein